MHLVLKYDMKIVTNKTTIKPMMELYRTEIFKNGCSTEIFLVQGKLLTTMISMWNQFRIVVSQEL